ncbi:hypothetical protein CPL00259L_CDS0064 [Escherichia phage McMelon]
MRTRLPHWLKPKTQAHALSSRTLSTTPGSSMRSCQAHHRRRNLTPQRKQLSPELTGLFIA